MEIELREVVRRNIRNRRNALSMPVDELAEMVDLSPSYIGAIERGEKAGSLETLCSIAKALNLEIVELFTNNDIPSRINPLAEKINGYLKYLDSDDCEHILDVCRFLKVKKDKQVGSSREKD